MRTLSMDECAQVSGGVLGTNGNSIYRPYNTPPGTVVTGNGIGVEIHDPLTGDAICIVCDDGSIIGLNPANSVNRALIIDGVNLMATDNSGQPHVVSHDGVDYMAFPFTLADGSAHTYEIRKDLWDDLGEGNLNGILAAGLIGAGLVDSATALLPYISDSDGDGDRDIHDFKDWIDGQFRESAQQALARNDNADAYAFTAAATFVPSVIDALAESADLAQGDHNTPGHGGDADGVGP